MLWSLSCWITGQSIEKVYHSEWWWGGKWRKYEPESSASITWVPKLLENPQRRGISCRAQGQASQSEGSWTHEKKQTYGSGMTLGSDGSWEGILRLDMLDLSKGLWSLVPFRTQSYVKVSGKRFKQNNKPKHFSSRWTASKGNPLKAILYLNLPLYKVTSRVLI